MAPAIALRSSSCAANSGTSSSICQIGCNLFPAQFGQLDETNLEAKLIGKHWIVLYFPQSWWMCVNLCLAPRPGDFILSRKECQLVASLRYQSRVPNVGRATPLSVVIVPQVRRLHLCNTEGAIYRNVFCRWAMDPYRFWTGATRLNKSKQADWSTSPGPSGSSRCQEEQLQHAGGSVAQNVVTKP